MQISKQSLLLPYLLIPVCFVVYILDEVFWNHAFVSRVPVSPDKLLLFPLFFGLPHIVASAFSFLDREYWFANRSKLQIPLALIIACAIGIDLHLLVLMVGAGTIYHNVSQQFGIASMMLKPRRDYFLLWKFSGFIVIGLSLAMVYFPELSGELFKNCILTFGLFFSCASLFLYSSVNRSSEKKALRFLLANYALIISAMFFALRGYAFFSFLIPTMIHDTTAFFFYVSHDKNRNTPQVYNSFYKVVGKTGISIAWLCPICAILIAFPITYYADFKDWAWVDRITIALNLAHFYYEGFIWKRESLHRRYVVLV